MTENIDDNATYLKRIKKLENGNSLHWAIIHIPTEQKRPTRLVSRFHVDDELRAKIKIGDSVGVFACAIYVGWQCHGLDGVLTLEGFGDSG